MLSMFKGRTEETKINELLAVYNERKKLLLHQLLSLRKLQV